MFWYLSFCIAIFGISRTLAHQLCCCCRLLWKPNRFISFALLSKIYIFSIFGLILGNFDRHNRHYSWRAIFIAFLFHLNVKDRGRQRKSTGSLERTFCAFVRCFYAHDGNQSIYMAYLHVHSNSFVHKSLANIFYTPQFTCRVHVCMHNIDMFGIAIGSLYTNHETNTILFTVHRVYNYEFVCSHGCDFFSQFTFILAPLIYQCFGTRLYKTLARCSLFIYKFTFLLRSAHSTTTSIINMEKSDTHKKCI